MIVIIVLFGWFTGTNAIMWWNGLVLFLGYIVLLGGTFFVIALRELPHAKERDRRRQRMEESDPAILAEEQPAPEAEGLAFPSTIAHLASRSTLLVLITICDLPFLGIGVWLLLSRSPRFTGLPFLLSILLFCVIPIAAITFFLMLKYPRWGKLELRVTEDGVSVDDGGKQQAIGWEEIRGFSRNDAPWIRRKSGSTRYELASAEKVVSWTRIRDPRIFNGAPPTTLFAEYDAKMERLLSLIRAKTGLPLYDVK